MTATRPQRCAAQELLVARAQAPELEDDEWWAEDLEGCAVRDGERGGRDRAPPAGAPLVRGARGRAAPGGGDLLVPLVCDAVRDVDVERREIDVDLRFLGRP